MEEDDRNIYMNALSVAFCMALFQLQGARACAQAGIEKCLKFFKTKQQISLARLMKNQTLEMMQ